MKLAIFSDIHGEFGKLKAIIDKLSLFNIGLICLGDLVSEDSDENDAVIDLIRFLDIPCVKGQHDDTCSKVDIPHIREDNRSYLAHLPETITRHDCLFVHDNPLERAKQGKGMWSKGSYIKSILESDVVFDEFDFEGNQVHYIFFGHSHIPKVFSKGEDIDFEFGIPTKILKGDYLINPGSIGGASRGNAKTGTYVIFDTDNKFICFLDHQSALPF